MVTHNFTYYPSGMSTRHCARCGIVWRNGYDGASCPSWQQLKNKGMPVIVIGVGDRRVFVCIFPDNTAGWWKYMQKGHHFKTFAEAQSAAIRYFEENTVSQ